MTTKYKMSKQTLGQYYTTNYEYILQNMSVFDDVAIVIEPFVGKGDLLNFIDTTKYTVECYDIDPQMPDVEIRDTILDPPDYEGKFIITNPPFLARNKSKNKEPFDKYQVNDLYKCFIKELTYNCAYGGIIITPINFWSSMRKSDICLRELFLNKYNILKLNIFEEQVFTDTTSAICSFQFVSKCNFDTSKCNLDVYIYPSGKHITTKLTPENNYMIGGSIYKLPTISKYSITRLTRLNKDLQNTNLVVKCIDNSSKINMSFKSKIYIDNTKNLSSRTYATLVITPVLNENQQKLLANAFNEFLNQQREQYSSLFLPNYRETTRKRISFNLVYQIVNYLLSTNPEILSNNL